ncbi:MAG: FkbM family methyltransferase [Bacteroidetes bacterium]|nr:FkbM family methyltransferase [Bacteroidota bacterium]
MAQIDKMLSHAFLQNIYRGIATRLVQEKSTGLRTLSLGWFQQKYLKHLPAGKTRTIKLHGKTLFYNAPQELLHGLQEIFVNQIYKQTLPPNALILDCGANIGLSLIWFKQSYPAARIIAFEPDPANFLLLQKNIDSFALDNITCHPAAVWKEDTILSFSAAKGMASTLTTAKSKDSIDVICLQLKKFLDQPIDFLKLDIEGAEWEVLIDCAGSLGTVKKIFIEYHGQFNEQNKLIQILETLNIAGFQFYIREAAPIYPTPFYRNKICLHPYQIQLNIFGFRDQ